MRVRSLKTALGPRFFLLAAWVLAIAWLSLVSKPPTPDTTLFGFDKFLHATAYGTLTLLAGWAFSGIAALSSRSWILIAVSAVAMSALMEAGQALFTTTRTAEVADLVANVIGAAAAVLLARIAKLARSSRQVTK